MQFPGMFMNVNNITRQGFHMAVAVTGNMRFNRIMFANQQFDVATPVDNDAATA